MKLLDWLTERGVTQEQFADRIGITQVGVSRLARGLYWPSGEVIAAIERETRGKVSASDVLKTYQGAARTRARHQASAAE